MFDLTEDTVNLLKVLSDPTRLNIIELLSKCTHTSAQIQNKLDRTQSTISQQLKTLIEANLVDYEKDGNNKLYFLKYNEILDILANLRLFIIEQKKKSIEELRELDRYDTLF
ncbi:MAG: metalloregulator ArsR/SmtB family transcription factor [Candidatus Lokiarchaeota archaeon]|nr:metalloregulator ArsR/SmtB family transcription factor [Candidatus Lokiarchaeota archaeon]MBD3199190.1 metalloregulator ArsR/SmtB family transcription factor [Candidatus Lokiarchaeota archaeon]